MEVHITCTYMLFVASCPGDYRECSVVLWSTYTYTVLTSTKTSQPIHELKWDPYTVNEFASVGDAGTLSFWLLDETQAEVTLSVHEAQLPHDLLETHHMVCVVHLFRWRHGLVVVRLSQ